MNDRRDVPQALRVCAVAVGVEQDVTKIHGTSFVDGTHKSVSADGGHLGRIHIPRGGIGAAVAHQTVLKSTGRVKSARCAMPFHSK